MHVQRDKSVELSTTKCKYNCPLIGLMGENC